MHSNTMHRFANPARFMRIAAKVMPVAALGALVLFGLGIYYGLSASPPDYQQGETVRIMYVHVPAAWMALFIYTSMAVASASALIWKHTLAHLYSRAVAPIGAAFTALCLITGSLWGEPTWGTWWAWDARLTSVLILFFLYLGYIVLVDAFDDADRGSEAGAILALVGVVMVPIIKFSVNWWNTLHQPSSIARMDGPAIDPSMLTPLLLMAGAYMCFYIAVGILRIRSEIAGRKLRTLQMNGLGRLADA